MTAWNRDFAAKTGLTMFAGKDPETKRHPWDETVYGLKDSAGNVVVPAKYANFALLGNDRIVVRQTWLEDDFYNAVAYGVIDLQGNFLLPCSTNHGGIEINHKEGNRTINVAFKNQLGMSYGRNSIALYDWNLNQLLPPKYSEITYVDNDCYILGINTGVAGFAAPDFAQMGI